MRSLSIATLFVAGTLVLAAAGLDGTASTHLRSTQSFARKYDQWLNQDVVYIISKEERVAFLQLRLEDERKEFIEQFWRRRNPVPESVENLFEDEHYRRIAYANAHFGTKTKLGWQTDRGHVYIVFGQPDSIDANPADTPNTRTLEEGRRSGVHIPIEAWHHKYLEGVGPDATVEFVDPAATGEYKLAADEGLRRAMIQVVSQDASDCPHCKLGLSRGSVNKFRELSELLTARIVRDQVSFDHSVSFEPVTDCTVLTSITVTVPVPPSSGASAGPSSRHFEGLIRVQDLTGWVVNVAEAEFPSSETSGADESRLSFTETFPLFAGRYRVQIALKNVATEEFGTQTLQVEVPRIPLKFH